jgi:hypothetical protein
MKAPGVVPEPPTVEVLPDAATWREISDRIYDTNRTRGIPTAVGAFAAGAFCDTDRHAMQCHQCVRDACGITSADRHRFTDRVVSVARQGQAGYRNRRRPAAATWME